MLSLVDLQNSLLDTLTEPAPARPLPRVSSELVATTYGFIEELRRADEAPRKPSVERPDLKRQHRRLEAMRAESAREAFATAQQFETSATAWARAAHSMYAIGEVAQAVEAARQVADITSRSVVVDGRPDAPAVYVAASVLALTGELGEADSLLATAGPDSSLQLLRAAIAAELGEFNRALALLEDVREHSAAALRAWLLLQVGAPMKALGEIRRVLRESDPDPAVMANMAYAFALLGSPRKAANAARQATILASANKSLGLNFVGYLLAMNSPERAISEIDRLSHGYLAKDPDLRLAKAGILWATGKHDRAIRSLNSLLNDLSADLDQRSKAEISTALIVFKSQLGSIARPQAISALRRLAGMAAGRSIYVIAAYADLVFSRSFLGELRGLIRQAKEWHTPEELLPLRAREAFLAGDIDEERDLINAWVAMDPFDQTAVAQQIYITGAHGDDFNAAAEVGLKALQRMPFSDPVRNNTAYVLAMAGRGEEAKRVLAGVQEKDRISIIATTGLAELALGNVAAGYELYKQAFALAEVDQDREFLQAALGLYQQIAVARLELNPAEGELLDLDLPADWSDNPVLARLVAVAKRLDVPIRLGGPSLRM